MASSLRKKKNIFRFRSFKGNQHVVNVREKSAGQEEYVILFMDM